MKPGFRFFFCDKAKTVTYESRVAVAVSLRSWRRNRDLFTVRRLSTHRYLVQHRRATVSAIIEATGASQTA